MRTMSNECEMKVMMVQRRDVRMKSAIEERFSVIVKVGRNKVGQLSVGCRIGVRGSRRGACNLTSCGKGMCLRSKQKNDLLLTGAPHGY